MESVEPVSSGDTLFTEYDEADDYDQVTVELEKGLVLDDLKSDRGTQFEIKAPVDLPDPDTNAYFETEEVFKQLNRECLGEDDDSEDEGSTPFDKMAKKMEDITPEKDGKVLKSTLRQGTGPLPVLGMTLTVHYNCYVEYSDEPYDSTRLRNKPERFKLGAGSVIPGMELGLSTMRQGETSKFLIHPDHAYGKLGVPPRIPADAKNRCPPGWSLFSSSCYYIDPESQTWAASLAVCQGYGAWLAEMKSDEENAYIGLTLGTETALWIDCKDDISEGSWLCGDDNHAITYTAWNPGEPNNLGEEDCMIIYNGVWYDIACTSQLRAVCKKDAVLTSRSMTFKSDDSNPGHCLKRNIIETIRPCSLIHCGGRCLQTADCASINYYPRRERCDLNSLTKAEADASHYTEVYNCVYYDILS